MPLQQPALISASSLQVLPPYSTEYTVFQTLTIQQTVCPTKEGQFEQMQPAAMLSYVQPPALVMTKAVA